jgi:AAA15 family ATPase/GTPase
VIIRFQVSNFRSFREPMTLLLTAGKEKHHRERLRRHGCFSVPLLPVALVFGANASGKTNLTEAIDFLRCLALNGVQAGAAIHRQAFKLDPAFAAKPTVFELDFVALNGTPYRYRIAVDDSVVADESLVEIRPSSEALVFRRTGAAFNLAGLLKSAEGRDRKGFLRFTAEGTRSNQPFLAEARQRAVTELQPVLDYFERALTVLGPDSKPITLEQELSDQAGFRDFLVERMKSADMGIEDIEIHELPLDQVDEMPREARDMIKAKLGPNEVLLIRTGKRHGQRFLARLKDGAAFVSTLRTRHSALDGGGVPFNLDEESDGTLRYIDLSLAFYSLAVKNSGHVFIVDELDRSLHPHLAREAMEAFLAGCGPDSKCQLIVTTHDTTLMTQDLFRRDEIWFTEKEPDGSTALHSLGDFKDLRYDTELQKNYLSGRLGGIPIIHHRPLAVSQV